MKLAESGLRAAGVAGASASAAGGVPIADRFISMKWNPSQSAVHRVSPFSTVLILRPFGSAIER